MPSERQTGNSSHSASPAPFDKGVQDPVARLLVGLPAEHHRAQAQLAHLQPGPAKKSILHDRHARTWSALHIKSEPEGRLAGGYTVVLLASLRALQVDLLLALLSGLG
jgi:hypothetical protein